MTKHTTSRLLGATAAVLLASVACAGPSATLPDELPPYADDKALPTPTIEKATLDNGMQIWIVPRDGMPRTDFVLAFKHAGLASDDAELPAFANLLAGLLTEGTAERDSRAIAEAAQGMGGGIGAGAEMDGIILYANAVTSKTDQMMSLLAEVARQPAFPEDEVKLAKDNAQQSLKAAEAQPGFRAERAMAAAMYGDHPYARTMFTAAGIEAVTRERLKSEHAKRFRPDNALLVITGRISKDDALKMAKAGFADWKVEGDAPSAGFPARREAKPSHLVIKREGSVQSAIRIGRPAIPATDPDYIALSMTRTVLGGGFSSRLMQNLREDKGYTYGAYASLRGYAGGGGVSAGADVRNEVTGASLKEFTDEFKRIGSEPVPADELQLNRRYVAGGYLISNQQQSSVASTLARNWLVGLPSEFLSEYVPLIQKVSPEQIMAMGKKYFDPAQQSIIVVGSPDDVAEQLTPYGEFTVQE